MEKIQNVTTSESEKVRVEEIKSLWTKQDTLLNVYHLSYLIRAYQTTSLKHYIFCMLNYERYILYINEFTRQK